MSEIALLAETETEWEDLPKPRLYEPAGIPDGDILTPGEVSAYLSQIAADMHRLTYRAPTGLLNHITGLKFRIEEIRDISNRMEG